MSKIFTVALLASIFSIFYNSNKKTELVHNGRCTGKANCSACKNCSACGHCNSGGSCGVCGGGTTYTNFSNYKNYSPAISTPPVKKTYKSVNDLRISNVIQNVNVRQRPSIKSKVLCTVSPVDRYRILKIDGKWTKVQIQKNNIIGYVSSKYINN